MLSLTLRCQFAIPLVVLYLAGCRPPSPVTDGGPAATPRATGPLTLLVVEDQSLGEAIAREWRSRTEQDIKLQHVQAPELQEAARLPGDAIVFSAELLGTLVERRLIAPLADAALNAPEFERRDIFDQVRLQEMVWGNRTLAVPIGSPRFVLAYRRDLLDRLNAAPPTTWEEYHELAARLADRKALGDLGPPDDEDWHAALEPLAGDFAARVLLARAASYALHRDQLSALFDYTSFDPLLAKPPYVRALTQLRQAVADYGFAGKSLTPPEVMQELLAGRAGLAVCWPAAPQVGSTLPTAAIGDAAIGFAVLPGSEEAYSFATSEWETRGAGDPQQVALLSTGGQMAGMSSTTAHPQETQTFLLWLASREASSAIGPQAAEAAMFRSSQLAQPVRWTGLSQQAAGKHAEALAATMRLPRTFPGPRLPGEGEYLAKLSAAVRACIAGEQQPDEALQQASADWQTITKHYGVENQRRALARGMGQATLLP